RLHPLRARRACARQQPAPRDGELPSGPCRGGAVTEADALDPVRPDGALVPDRPDVALASGPPDEAEPVRFRIDLGYAGTDFHGWAVQPSLRTVQGVVEAGLEQVCGQPVRTVVAGRTDAGVHA